MSRKKPAARRTPPRTPGGQPGNRGNPAGRNRPPAGGRSSAAKGRPLPKGGAFFTPNASPFRQQMEQASAPLLVLFHRMPRIVFAALPLVLLVLGAFLPVVPLALVFLAIALLLLTWLAYLSWPRAEGGQKAMRLVVPGLVIAIAIMRIANG